METLLGIDLGTSATKGVLLAADGRILARDRRPTELIRPRPGWVEFSSPRCHEILCDVIQSLLKAAPRNSRVVALCLSGATGNALLMDGQGEPLGHAINWMDTRSVDDPLVDPVGISPAEIYRAVGWPYFRGFPLLQLTWLKRNQPEQFRRASMVAMNITYLYHRLCGKYGMDHSTASTFYLQDQVNRRWHKPLLDLLELDETRLPELMPSTSILGGITRKAARETGLQEGTAVVLGSFDHPSAARGVGVLNPGEVLLSCGTSWVGFYPVCDRELILSQTMLSDPFLTPAGPWGAIFSLACVGSQVEDLVNRTFPSEPSMAARYARFNEAAAKAARGSSDPCRSIMESIARDMKAKVQSLARAGLEANRLVMVGGPTESDVWTAILADELGLEISLPETGAYAGALGAAMMAGIGLGLFADETDAFSRLSCNSRIQRPA